MKILAIIPARMGSSRFPGKPLEKILNKPMIAHVYDQVEKNPLLSSTIVATCDNEIADYIKSINAKFVMTGNHHERATDRCAEAIEIFEKQQNIIYDIIIMVQGDEPMINTEMISECIQPMLDDSKIKICNLMGKIENNIEFNDPNVVKVICDNFGNALYFSRASIPHQQNFDKNNSFKQYGIIAFKRDFLLEYLEMKPTSLEIIESIDMLRIIENGIPLKMICSNYNIYTVDTPSDLKMVVRLMKGKIN